MDMALPSAARELGEEAGRISPEPQPYAGFPWWHALTVTPGREAQSADLLERVRVFVYLPRYIKQVRCSRAKDHRAVLRAVIPGLLFVPREMMDIDHRDRIFDFCRIRGYVRNAEGFPTRISKANIEDIRAIEARLNWENRAPDPNWKPHRNEPIRFKVRLFAEFLGKGIVVALESGQRIRVRLRLLFGQEREITVPLADVEPDVADDPDGE